MNYRTPQKLSIYKRLGSNITKTFLFVSLLFVVAGCFDNSPYPSENKDANTLYYNYTEEPDNLDPAKAYSADLLLFIEQIYEPTLQFHYLKRPSVLEGLTATSVPLPISYDIDGNKIANDAPLDKIKKVVYRFNIKKGILYQDHASFAIDKDGKHIFHLGEKDIFTSNPKQPDDLLTLPSAKNATALTRELKAKDYVYQLKRLADPKNDCPLYEGTLKTFIIGYTDLHDKLKNEFDNIKKREVKKGNLKERYYIDLRDPKYDIEGLKIIDDYTFEIALKRPYPQFTYWLSMAFFCPIPWEVDKFYRQNACQDLNFSLKRFPVGTGPYKLTENRSNYRIVLERNKNYRKAYYPTEGAPASEDKASDKDRGLLDDAGKQIPFIDRAVFMLEKEGMPRYKKFVQGYYDLLEPNQLGSSMFDSAVDVTANGDSEASEEMTKRKIVLLKNVRASVRYFAFNMQDKTVGGYSEKQIKLRQALSIAFDVRDQIDILENGRGKFIHGPLPKGIIGNHSGKSGMNPTVYKWDDVKNQPVLRDLSIAKQLLKEAGYPGGVHEVTGRQLKIKFNIPSSAGNKTLAKFVKKQFAKIGVALEAVESTQNKWKEKLKTGDYQFIWYGWFADYPDAENFMFLLYGPQKSVGAGGINYANYENPEYDRKFEIIETMPNTPERLRLIEEMQQLVRKECPWIFDYTRVEYTMHQGWLKNYKAKFIGGGNMKYWKIDPEMRKNILAENNKPFTAPIWITAILILIASIYATITTIKRDRGGVSL